jgi:hypothetical protein
MLDIIKFRIDDYLTQHYISKRQYTRSVACPSEFNVDVFFAELIGRYDGAVKMEDCRIFEEEVVSNDAGSNGFRFNVIHPQFILTIAGRLDSRLFCSYAGNPQFLAPVAQWFESDAFTNPPAAVEWVYAENGNSVTIELDNREFIPEAYPFISEDPHAYMRRYMESKSSVLVLIGPPGTGKTSFLKQLIRISRADALLSYDDRILSGDGFFANFMQNTAQRMLIMEDADTFLSVDRERGNNLLHKFLNIADGVMSSNKKIIFSTNLASINKVDPALLRPGRCFDVINFRNLTRSEAVNVNSALGLPELPELSVYNLSTVGNHAEHHAEAKPTRAAFGFGR